MKNYIYLLILLLSIINSPINGEINDNNSNLIENNELSVELFEIAQANLYVMDTDDNKFIGYANLYKTYPELHIGNIYIYEKYIVLEEFYQIGERWYGSGFRIYEYDKNLRYSEYKNLGKKLYDCIGENKWFQGINSGLLFIDLGTGPGTRGIDIVDLANNTTVLSAGYYRRFIFNNNNVSGLVFTERMINSGHGIIDDNIKKIFFDYLEKTEKPDENEKAPWVSILFILNYEYNILTKEINYIIGEYIDN
jgi:hypothetical protein